MKLTESLWAKITAVFLVFFATVGFALGTAGSIAANELGLYVDVDIPYVESASYRNRAAAFAGGLAWDYYNDRDSFARTVEQGYSQYSAGNTNIVFTIRDDTGAVCATNDTGRAATGELTFRFAGDPLTHRVRRVYDDGEASETAPKAEPKDTLIADDGLSDRFTVTVSLPVEKTVADKFLFEHNLYRTINRGKHRLLWLCGASALTLTIAVVFLFCAAGHHAGREGITLNPLDRLPYDLYLCLLGLITMMLLLAGVWLAENIETFYNIYGIILGVALAGVLALTALAAGLTTATRFKAGGWWRNTILWRLLRLLAKLCIAAAKCVSAVALQWRVALLVGAFLFCFWFFAMHGAWDQEFQIVVIGLGLIAVTLCCLTAARFGRVVRGGQAIAGGQIDEKIELKGLHGSLRGLAEDLNSIGDGLSIAVEDRIKSERLKTELITNVSHDIKTPLTSLINYVDLLKKEPLEGNAAEYADILEKHANRLKKLTVDLIEASKAATGNIQAELVPVDLCELVDQALAEYDERLAQSRVTPVVTVPDGPRTVLADSKLIWRVLDNLLSNAAKYSQEGTRLYIDVLDRGEQVVLAIKNISRERLNIDPAELTERFVRGDSARHTEGSGLGLNIAKSLTEIQNGRLTIEIDGDLFKTELVFDRLITQ